MIRIIAYVSLILGMVLSIANLTMSHSLAGDGQYLSALTAKREHVRQTIAGLQDDVAFTQSLSTIRERARELGLTSPVTQRAFPASDLASHP